ncbi:Zn(2)-C6 fungal-type DNA-binding domain protein [Pleurostoma richardsiae]|uniref:Zn(2)-C6 fungal-type DNA-binding domain protein n=1 Tax=Pleurostoma richardsiae TaxID=41990 RepID=A0AA38VSX4_9PEZI|nr:Zn(2)-C6 fungal-type DNA-binding domain protein [Pleurostoma richardsiae]
MMSSKSLAQDGPFPSRLLATDLEHLTVDAHPVFIAHQMLLFATQLQKNSYFERADLSDGLLAIMDRLINATTALVTTNEEFYGTVEILQCMIMEAAYQLGNGSIQKSWRANRRAMLVAQEMGVHCPCNRKFKTLDPRTEINREVVWFRILYSDRYYCLILGFPQGSSDTSMAFGPAMADDEPLGRLDRAHAAVAARLLERIDGRDLPPEEDSAVTRMIDTELLRAAKAMPIKFWLQPNFHGISLESNQEFWETWRGMSQVYHYNLINQLHLRQLLRFKSDGSGDYSKLACMSANREVLARYMSYRATNARNGSCLTFDFLTLMAAITLLLAHLDNHIRRRAQSTSVLEHQRLCDRTMLEQVLSIMETISEVTHDPMSESSIKMLRCLLRIEEDAAEGGRYSAQCVQQPGHSRHGGEEDHEGPWDNRTVLRICIPYFGFVRIVREGTGPAESGFLPTPQSSEELGMSLPANPGAGHSLDSLGLLQAQQPLIGEARPPTNPVSEQSFPAPPTTASYEECPLQEYWNPGMMEGADDWAFQGVDLGFFDTR